MPRDYVGPLLKQRIQLRKDYVTFSSKENPKPIWFKISLLLISSEYPLQRTTQLAPQTHCAFDGFAIKKKKHLFAAESIFTGGWNAPLAAALSDNNKHTSTGYLLVLQTTQDNKRAASPSSFESEY